MLSNKKNLVVWENLPVGINRIFNTQDKKEIVVFEEMGNHETTEEYVEVKKTTKKYKSFIEPDI